MNTPSTTNAGPLPAARHALAADSFGAWALLHKETMRFAKVAMQTILAPVVSSLLFLLIFSYLLEGRMEPYPGVTYSSFLVPGLVMMTLQQNAFANTSSSITQSKMTGNLVFVLLSPMRPWEWLVGYVGGAVLRGLVCGLGVWMVAALFVPTSLSHAVWAATFAILACVMLACLGFIAGLWALTMLAGVFYSTHDLPALWQAISHLNPFFYLIDGFRFGIYGISDVSPWFSLTVSALATLTLTLLTVRLVAIGWRIRG